MAPQALFENSRVLFVRPLNSKSGCHGQIAWVCAWPYRGDFSNFGSSRIWRSVVLFVSHLLLKRGLIASAQGSITDRSIPRQIGL
jgi:hypothetical protein